MLIIAISFIFAACILYTLGVWAEKIKKKLLAWHAVVFWLIPMVTGMILGSDF